MALSAAGTKRYQVDRDDLPGIGTEKHHKQARQVPDSAVVSAIPRIEYADLKISAACRNVQALLSGLSEKRTISARGLEEISTHLETASATIFTHLEATTERPAAVKTMQHFIGFHRYLSSFKMLQKLTGEEIRLGVDWELPHQFTALALRSFSGRKYTGKLIAQGRWTRVYLFDEDPSLIAKVYTAGMAATHYAAQYVERERVLLTTLDRPFPRCVFADYTHEPCALFIERVPGMNMKDRLSKDSHPYTFSELKKDLKGWLLCLMQLHARNLVHSDIRLSTLMPGVVVGLEKVQVEGEVEDMGEMSERSPEQILQSNKMSGSMVARRSADMWRLGAALFQIFRPDHAPIMYVVGGVPSQKSIDEKIQELEVLTNNAELSAILSPLLRLIPQERISSHQLFDTLYK